MRIKGDIPESVGEDLRKLLLKRVRDADKEEEGAKDAAEKAEKAASDAAKALKDAKAKAHDAHVAYVATFGDIPALTEQELRERMVGALTCSETYADWQQRAAFIASRAAQLQKSPHWEACATNIQGMQKG